MTPFDEESFYQIIEKPKDLLTKIDEKNPNRKKSKAEIVLKYKNKLYVHDF